MSVLHLEEMDPQAYSYSSLKIKNSLEYIEDSMMSTSQILSRQGSRKNLGLTDFSNSARVRKNGWRNRDKGGVDPKVLAGLVGTCPFHCRCALCRAKMPYENKPYYHGLNYITEEDLTLRKTLLSTKMKAPYETDFVFVLNRLRNHLHTDQGEMNLLIAETIVFEKGIPKYILKKGARNEPGKYSYFEEKEKLNSLEIKKYLFKRKKVKRYLEEFLPENLEARLRRSKNGSKAGKTARKKKAVSSFTLSKEKLLQMDYERRKKREEARNRFRIYFSKIGEKGYEIADQRQFIMIMQLSKGHKFWKEIDYFQPMIFNANNEINMIKYRFHLGGHFVDKELFDRAIFEPRLLFDVDIPKSSIFYKSPEEEKTYTRALMSQDPRKYCEFATHKIYHFIKIFHKITLKRFHTEFAKNQVGDWELIKVLIYDASCEEGGDFYAISKQRKRVYKLESMMASKIREFLRNEAKTREMMGFRDTRQENREFERLSKVKRRNDRLGVGFTDVAKGRKKMSIFDIKEGSKSLAKRDVSKRTFDKMKTQFLSDVDKFKKGCVDNSSSVFSAQLDSLDQAYKRLRPSVKGKLSDLVSGDDYQYGWVRNSQFDPKNNIKALDPRLETGGELNWVKKVETKLVEDRLKRAVEELRVMEQYNGGLYQRSKSLGGPQIAQNGLYEVPGGGFGNGPRGEIRVEESPEDGLVTQMIDREYYGVEKGQKNQSEKNQKSAKKNKNRSAGKADKDQNPFGTTQSSLASTINANLPSIDSNSQNDQNSVNKQIEKRKQLKYLYTLYSRKVRNRVLPSDTKIPVELQTIFNKSIQDFNDFSGGDKRLEMSLEDICVNSFDKMKLRREKILKTNPFMYDDSDGVAAETIRTNYVDRVERAAQSLKNKNPGARRRNNAILSRIVHERDRGALMARKRQMMSTTNSSFLDNMIRFTYSAEKPKKSKMRNKQKFYNSISQRFSDDIPDIQKKNIHYFESQIRDMKFLEHINLLPTIYLKKKVRMKQIGLRGGKWNWNPQQMESICFELVDTNDLDQMDLVELKAQLAKVKNRKKVVKARYNTSRVFKSAGMAKNPKNGYDSFLGNFQDLVIKPVLRRDRGLPGSDLDTNSLKNKANESFPAQTTFRDSFKKSGSMNVTQLKKGTDYKHMFSAKKKINDKTTKNRMSVIQANSSNSSALASGTNHSRFRSTARPDIFNRRRSAIRRKSKKGPESPNYPVLQKTNISRIFKRKGSGMTKFLDLGDESTTKETGTETGGVVTGIYGEILRKRNDRYFSKVSRARHEGRKRRRMLLSHITLQQKRERARMKKTNYTMSGVLDRSSGFMGSSLVNDEVLGGSSLAGEINLNDTV